MDSNEYLILYNNIYIKGLNSLVENYGELIAYAVGVKLSSIYLKISPIEPTFYFHFGLGVGPTLDLTVHQESYVSPLDSNFKSYVLLTVEKAEDHINLLNDFENLIFYISYNFYIIYVSIYFIFLIVNFINYVKFISYIKNI